MARQPGGFLQEASHQIAAGGSAVKKLAEEFGFNLIQIFTCILSEIFTFNPFTLLLQYYQEKCLVEICLMHPLDVVKTRFQIQRGKTDPTSYKSLGDCFRTIFQREGLLGFYKGILPPILAETPKRAVKFFTFEQYRKLLGYASLPPGLAFAVAGLGSGLTEAIVVNPFEVVKVTLQANRNSFTEQPSSFVQAQQIIKTDGLGLHGLNKGLTATLGRHGVFNMVYFGFYFNVKNILPVNKDPNLEFLRKFGIGLVSGTIASIINIPFDVAKSRIQGPQPVPGEIKYRTCLKTMATVYKEEGFLALYKGLIPKIMRLGPGDSAFWLRSSKSVVQ
eukprot:XP_025006687.1 mitochondrial 2-oxodicarboxylate carrier isoform X3 [Gallus gallus]